MSQCPCVPASRFPSVPVSQCPGVQNACTEGEEANETYEQGVGTKKHTGGGGGHREMHKQGMENLTGGGVEKRTRRGWRNPQGGEGLRSTQNQSNNEG